MGAAAFLREIVHVQASRYPKNFLASVPVPRRPIECTRAGLGPGRLRLERYVALGGLPYAIARLANVYGPRQRGTLEGGVVAIFSERLATRQPVTIYGSGDQRQDFIHVSDVIAALLVMGESCQNDLWNVGTGEETTVSELLHQLESVLGAAIEVRHLPARPGDIFASSLSFGPIRAELGWRPQLSLLDGLRATASP
jgi:UDP-glucose 4-epimerase